MTVELNTDSNQQGNPINEKIDITEKTANFSQTFQLSDCQFFQVFLLCIFSPICGYLYTRRWKALFWFLIGSCLSVSVVLVAFDHSKKATEHAQTVLAISVITVATIDNCTAISKARRGGSIA